MIIKPFKGVTPILNKKKKPKLLLLADDIRLTSGIATMAKEIVLGTAHKYDWVQLAGAINHPDKNKIIDISADVNKEANITDASVRLYPVDDYGNEQILMHVLETEKVDAIVHFTDPRFWIWLYNIEYKIRQKTPILYWTIWDCHPAPRWNKPFYQSSDMLMAISKQTYSLIREVFNDDINLFNSETKQNYKSSSSILSYVPHGINQERYFPIRKSVNKINVERYTSLKSEITQGNNKTFILMYNNRNAQRKHPHDVILSYKLFCDKIGHEKAKRCLLLMHTNPIDNNGTDLLAIKENICPEYDIMFSAAAVSTEDLNYMYNISSVVINISSNEGFGLTTAEALMAGTPIIANVTGGLQDQMGFKHSSGEYLTLDDYHAPFHTNSIKKYTEHGEWVFPIFPATIGLQGSPLTPYIFDERANIKDIVEQIYNAYNTPENELKDRGLKGREYLITNGFTGENMCKLMMENIDFILTNFTPRKRINLVKFTPNKKTALTIQI